MAVVLLGWCCVGAACGQQGIALMPGVVNNPANRSLRRALFSFAQGSLCEQLRRTSVPLKFRKADPSIGRFFPQTCAVRALANENLFVELTGHGYAWTNLTGRMGFQASAAVEYDHDFVIDDGSMYVYFRQASTQKSELQVKMVERQGQLRGATLASLLGGGDVQQMVQRVGSRILKHQLGRGFTVIRHSDGDTEFGMGLLERGERPLVPFDKADSDWPLLANDRSELHSGQRDYVGPFYIDDESHALHLTAVVEGAPAVDVLVVAKPVGDGWVSGYESYAAPAAPPGPVFFQQALVAAPSGAAQPLRQQLQLPPGGYYVVFDHTAVAGVTSPVHQARDDRAALVSYGVQLGEVE